MITVKDCEALCDANPDWVHELACRECLTMVPAFARAHELMVCASHAAMQGHPADAAKSPSDRLPTA